MRQTPVDDYLEEISTELPEELYGNLSDAIYETVCEFDEEIAQLKSDNAKLRELVSGLEYCVQGYVCDSCPLYDPSGANHRRCESLERELGIEVDE